MNPEIIIHVHAYRCYLALRLQVVYPDTGSFKLAIYFDTPESSRNAMEIIVSKM